MDCKTVADLEKMLGSTIPVQAIKPKLNPRTGRFYIPASGELVERQLMVLGISVEMTDTVPQWQASGFIMEKRASDGVETYIHTTAII